MQKRTIKGSAKSKYIVKLATIGRLDERAYKYEGMIITQERSITRSYGASEIKIKSPSKTVLEEQLRYIINGIEPGCMVNILDMTERR